MTHDELLKLLTPTITHSPWVHFLENPNSVMSALRAVVELHKPLHFEGRFSSYYVCEICSDTYEYVGDSVEYPCPTIQAIEKELSVGNV